MISKPFETDLDSHQIAERWLAVESHEKYPILKNEFELFVSISSNSSECFRYWSLFLDVIMPILTDLTHSFRQANWDMHLSVLR